MTNTVYIIRNKINNKIYIGQTWLSFEDRWNGGRGYKRNPYFHAAIKKHGEINFRYEVLMFCGTQETADYWEVYFINKYQSTNRKIGYNIRSGGEGGGKLSENTKKKLSIINTGKKLSEEVKEKLRVASMGNKYSLGFKASDKTKVAVSKTHKGKIVSAETKIKMREAALGRIVSEETKQKMRKPKSEIAKNNLSMAKRKLTPEQDKLIKLDLRTNKIIAQEYGVSVSAISRARKR